MRIVSSSDPYGGVNQIFQMGLI